MSTKNIEKVNKKEVFRLRQQGKSIKAIAVALKVSPIMVFKVLSKGPKPKYYWYLH